MRKKLGVLCLCLGILSLLSALGFLGYNQWEASKAQRMSQSLLVQVQKSLATEEEKSPAPAETSHTEAGDSTSEPATEEAVPGMPTIEVKGYDCIGILSIPVLELELLILTDWDYTKLKIAPACITGTIMSRTLSLLPITIQPISASCPSYGRGTGSSSPMPLERSVAMRWLFWKPCLRMPRK